MLPSEAYQHQLGIRSHGKTSVRHYIDQSYKNNSFQNHQLFRQACYQTKALHCKDLYLPFLISFDFFRNGEFFVAGTFDGNVALWHTTQLLGHLNLVQPTSIFKIFENGNMVSSIATSPDDKRIVCNDMRNIAIHDAIT